MRKLSLQAVDALRDAAERYTQARAGCRPMPELDRERIALWAAALAFAAWFGEQRETQRDAEAVERLLSGTGLEGRRLGAGEEE